MDWSITRAYFKHTSTFSHLHGGSHIVRHIVNGKAISEIVQTLHNTSSPAYYFRKTKRILIKILTNRIFQKRLSGCQKDWNWDEGNINFES